MLFSVSVILSVAKDLAESLAKFVPASECKLVYKYSASAAELNGNIKSQRGILDFSPFGFTAKADVSGVDLKVRVAQDDRSLWVNFYIIPLP